MILPPQLQKLICVQPVQLETFNGVGRAARPFELLKFTHFTCLRRLIIHSTPVFSPQVIGFTGYSLPKSSSENTGRAFFKKNKSLVNSQYTNSRQVSRLI